MELIIFLIFLIFVIIIWDVVYIVNKCITINNYFTLRGVSVKKNIYGNTWKYVFNMQEFLPFIYSLYDEFPNEKYLFSNFISFLLFSDILKIYFHRITGFYSEGLPIYLIRDAAIFKQIAISGFSSFENHQFLIGPEMDSVMGNTLFSLCGKKWQMMRKHLKPGFTSVKLTSYFKLVQKCAIQSCMAIAEKENEMVDLFSRYSNDVILSTAFGVEINSFLDRHNKFGNGKENSTIFIDKIKLENSFIFFCSMAV